MDCSKLDATPVFIVERKGIWICKKDVLEEKKKEYGMIKIKLDIFRRESNIDMRYIDCCLPDPP